MEILQRLDIDLPLADLIQEIALHYHVGTVESFELILEGYDDVNVSVVAEAGRYLFKVFRTDKSITAISDSVRVQEELSRLGGPVPALLSVNKEYLYSRGESGCTVHACAMEFVDGRDFDHIQPTCIDIKCITNFLSTLHSLDFEVASNYDSWGTANIAAEFEKKKSCLPTELLGIIGAIVTKFDSLDLSLLERRVIHGDLHKKNVLKASDGRCYVVDFSCLDFNCPVFDLGIFLALFCIDLDRPSTEALTIQSVIDEYNKGRRLKPQEIELIPLMIQATYAMYALSAQYLISVEHDHSQQTRHWLTVGRKGLLLLG